MKHSKEFNEGRKAYRKGLKWTANPYPVGSKKWDDWNQGKSAAGEKDEIKLFKAYPNLLKGS